MDFHELLNCWSQRGGKAVLATVIAVEGHAYRKEGASMIIFEDGERVGGISPGCLEVDLAERVAGLLEAKGSQIVDYDMMNTDDFAWGEAVGCGGSIRVLLESIHGRLNAILQDLLVQLNRGKTSCFIRNWGQDGLLDYRIESMAYEPELAVAVEGDWALLMLGDDNRECFVLHCDPRPRLILFGAGADAEPIAVMAGKVGFHVVVADWREALCCSGHFAGCDTVVGSPEEWIGRLGVNTTDYVVIMSHQMQKDRQCLDALWVISPRYVGLLGSEKRAGQMLDGRVPPAWLRWPVGLCIGAEGPMEIAVSVVAELIAVRRHADVRSGRRGSRAAQNIGDLHGSGRKSAYGDSEAHYIVGQ